MSGHKCFHCQSEAVFWNGDFTFEDYGIDDGGIIHLLTCAECGAVIEYRVSDDRSRYLEREAEGYLLETGVIQCGDCGFILLQPFSLGCGGCGARIGNIVAEG